MATTFWQAVLSLFLIKNHYFFEENFTFWDFDFDHILVNFGDFCRFSKNQEIQDGRSNIATIWEQNIIVMWMMSSANVVDLNGNIFGHTICP